MSRTHFPEEWGILVPRQGKFRPVELEDIALLEGLRFDFEAYAGEPIPYSDMVDKYFDGEVGPNNWLSKALNRLWMEGYVEKFATMLHTQSGRPEYISWYIWGKKVEPKPDVPQFTYVEEE